MKYKLETELNSAKETKKLYDKELRLERERIRRFDDIIRNEQESKKRFEDELKREKNNKKLIIEEMKVEREAKFKLEQLLHQKEAEAQKEEENKQLLFQQTSHITLSQFLLLKATIDQLKNCKVSSVTLFIQLETALRTARQIREQYENEQKDIEQSYTNYKNNQIEGYKQDERNYLNDSDSFKSLQLPPSYSSSASSASSSSSQSSFFQIYSAEEMHEYSKDLVENIALIIKNTMKDEKDIEMGIQTGVVLELMKVAKINETNSNIKKIGNIDDEGLDDYRLLRNEDDYSQSNIYFSNLVPLSSSYSSQFMYENVIEAIRQITELSNGVPLHLGENESDEIPGLDDEGWS
ncbi:MAG: hypothetical protein EZS28_017396 [Streblomastix strix]|uniref:Uncharacterized protein n=1 Tax=Streblomastix strix TaxID=222440 RepID=A0A5J4VXP9_9EUKA|nr:MAG: hypothetical protein EZS28_017396 [Streblomastix strix]